MAQMILPTKLKQIMDMESRLMVARAGERGVGWAGSLGLVATNGNIWNGWAQGTGCDRLTLLYSRN